MADEAKGTGEIDDWLADLDEEPANAGAAAAAGGELDQSDIDALLGGGSAPAPAPAAADESALELDQSDIDSLFGEAGAASAAPPPPQSAPAEAGEDLTQAGIDELLGGDSAPAATPAPAGEVGLDQSDIDSLFASPAPDKGSPLTEGEEAPSQEEMDELFGSIGLGPTEEATVASAPASETRTVSADEPGAETITFSDVLHEAGSGADDFALDDSGFAADAFAFDDSIPDIPDETALPAEKKASAAKAAAEDMFADTGSQQEDLTALLAAGEESLGTKGGGKPSAAMSSSISKSTIGIAVVAMLALGGGAYYFMTRPKTVAPPPPLPVAEQARTVAPAPPANHPPTVKDEEVRIDEASNTAAITLTAQDADHDKLQFEIVKPPEHGRLSGELPSLTYLPNPDFPGEDTVEFLAADGKDASPPGRIRIVGRDLRQQAEAKKEAAKVAKPARPVVRAVDVALSTLSGQPLVIDWKKVWQKANRAAYSSAVQVEIVEAGLAGGELSGLGPAQHRYQPQRYFHGTETIRYRFHKAGVASPTRQLMVRVVPGGSAPEVVVKPLADAYPIGATVVLDVRATRSATPEALTFKWEQVGGAAILLEPMNAHSSAVAFVMPSFFSRETAPQPVVQVTVTDAFGRRATRTITVGVEARRRSPSALWRGMPEGGVAPEPALPLGAYPGRL
ncbi:MAG: Ig-like domain-containing protein [Thermodesulfobacteriota bacterium]